jgi:3-oxoacyl-[acyl-carrier-protein] synthase III
VRWDDVYLRATASWLPPVMSAQTAVDRGLTDAESVRRMQITGVTVGERTPPDMAVSAARGALARADCGPADIVVILHAALYYQGYDMWAPASYIQRRAVGNQCPAIEVRQTSNGAMAALQLAATYLLAEPTGAALVTTADRFCLPGIDRWRSDPGTVLADGATAAVLARGSGFARLRSLVLLSQPELEQMHRGDDPPSPAPLTLRRPVDLEATTRAYLRGPDGQRLVAEMMAAQEESLRLALDEAELKLSDVDRFVLPHFGRRRLDVYFFRRLGIEPDRTMWSWSRGIGHLGAGDQLAALTRLVEAGELRPGERCLLLGVGGGFTWSAAVLEIVDVPTWPASDSVDTRADL